MFITSCSQNFSNTFFLDSMRRCFTFLGCGTVKLQCRKVMFIAVLMDWWGRREREREGGREMKMYVVEPREVYILCWNLLLALLIMNVWMLHLVKFLSSSKCLCSVTPVLNRNTYKFSLFCYKQVWIPAFYRMSFDWIHWSQVTVTLTAAQKTPDWKSDSYWGEVNTFRLVRFIVLVEIMTLSFVSGLLNRASWI